MDIIALLLVHLLFQLGINLVPPAIALWAIHNRPWVRGWYWDHPTKNAIWVALILGACRFVLVVLLPILLSAYAFPFLFPLEDFLLRLLFPEGSSNTVIVLLLYFLIVSTFWLVVFLLANLFSLRKNRINS